MWARDPGNRSGRPLAYVMGFLAAASVLAGCGGSGSSGDSPAATSQTGGTTASSASPTPSDAAPQTPADGGLGTWAYSDAGGAITVAFLPDGAPAAAKLAEACRKVSSGDPVLWATVKVENLSGSVLMPSAVTIVTGEGEQIRMKNAVGTVNAWQASASTNDAKAKCYEYNTRANFAQMGLGVAAGATVVELNSAPATVKSVKSVSLNVNGSPIQLSYT